ncbi:MAG: hypothetical protein NZM37_01615 [Sandaracinaceae bacterium]|nr:hypothetical protein [Sandaracinaceae bacterium]
MSARKATAEASNHAAASSRVSLAPWLRGGDRLSPVARAIGLSEEDCRSIRRHAIRLESRGEWQKALDAYRVAMIVEPLQASNWFGLARCYRRTGDEETAKRIELCARIIEEKTL